MTANNRARNPCKPREPGLHGRDGWNALKVNLVDAEWTSGSWPSVPVSKTGWGLWPASPHHVRSALARRENHRVHGRETGLPPGLHICAGSAIPQCA